MSVRVRSAAPLKSLSSWRAWIEIETSNSTKWKHRSLSSWRAWIEILDGILQKENGESLSSWRAWIEMQIDLPLDLPTESLSSWRAWIEIYQAQDGSNRTGRSPHGERGLKSHDIDHGASKLISRSPHGERGLKSRDMSSYVRTIQSLSSWRAWIEILRYTVHRRLQGVALLMESVD